MMLVLLLGCSSATTATPIPATPVPATPIPSIAPPTEQPAFTASTWNKTYGGRQNDEAWDALPAVDGGYFIVGTTNVQYEPQMRGDIYLVRTDAAGAVLWEKTYGGPGYETGETIFPSNDGNLIIAGYTNSFGAGGMDSYLIKVDQDGNELCSKTFGGALDEMTSARQTTDGGYILIGNIVDPNDIVADPGAAGYGGFAGRSNIYLSKVDAAGAVLWEKTYGGGDNNILAADGVQTPDGGGIILATLLRFPEPGDYIYLLKVDADGDEVWSRTWEEGTLGAYDLIPTADGAYLIVGSYTPPEVSDLSQADFLFIKVDSEGNEIWRQILGDPDIIDYGKVAVETADGGFVVAGDWQRNLTSWDSDIVVVKIDASGKLVWKQIIETNTHSMFGTLLLHPDGGYLIVGTMWRDPQWDVFLIKTNSEGRVEK